MKKQLFFVLLLVPASIFSMKLIPKRSPKAVASELQEEKEKQKEKKRVAALLLAGAQNIPPTPKCQTQTGKKGEKTPDRWWIK